MAQTSESPEFPADDGRCPCTSGLVFGECCGPVVRGIRPAPTAVQLMRSRFTAFAIGLPAHLLATWHTSTRPTGLDLDPGLRWFRLDILRTELGGPLDRTGVVEFEASYRHDGERGVQHEVSTFVREAGRWFYVAALD
ncbi:SEC-C motif-containing protein [Agromyces sp. CF514]|uniref:YchJ family protein n=1 Tax=Agromyces sp. CF514 TaxID=1881031 RepID=UPI0008EBCA6E|nr:YchJ family metal-binding protein [Agromyces sp. CF514]SFR79266.1 SEC-C motif-containing protein [Agromyces sp. CF514]